MLLLIISAFCLSLSNIHADLLAVEDVRLSAICC